MLSSDSKGSLIDWSSLSAGFGMCSASSMLTLKGELKSATLFFFDEEIGIWVGEPLKKFTFELGVEKMKYLKEDE